MSRVQNPKLKEDKDAYEKDVMVQFFTWVPLDDATQIQSIAKGLGVKQTKLCSYLVHALLGNTEILKVVISEMAKNPHIAELQRRAKLKRENQARQILLGAFMEELKCPACGFVPKDEKGMRAHLLHCEKVRKLVEQKMLPEKLGGMKK